RLLIELGPLAVFYGVYFKGADLFGFPEGEATFYAVGAFAVAFTAAFIASFVRERRIAPMLMITAVIVAATTILTLVLRNEVFTYVKPTLINLAFAVILGGGLATGRLFLKTVFDQAFTLEDDAWRTLTYRFMGFFVFLAILNEAVWRMYAGDCIPGEACDGRDVWVHFKFWGVLPLTIIFTMAQTPFIMKHNQDPAE
ncbi:MAG: septation protein IspZ, partial [Pseudomonadota bacterium]